MVQQRQLEHLCVFHCPPHHVVVLHAVAVIGDRHHARLLERSDGRQFFPREVLRDGARDQDVHHPLLRRAFVNQGYRSSIINRRRRISKTELNQ